MKIYYDYVYTVIEVNMEQFVSVTEHLIEPLDIPDVKYLLGNQEETDYLSEVLDIDPIHIQGADYFKIILAEF